MVRGVPGRLSGRDLVTNLGFHAPSGLFWPLRGQKRPGRTNAGKPGRRSPARLPSSTQFASMKSRSRGVCLAPRIFGCRETALELVSGADFSCTLMCGAGPGDLGVPGIGFGRKSKENRAENLQPNCFQVPRLKIFGLVFRQPPAESDSRRPLASPRLAVQLIKAPR